MFESRGGVFFIAGVFFFALAFVSNGLVAMLLYADRPEQTALQTVNNNLLIQFASLRQLYPEQVRHYFGDITDSNQHEKAAEMLKLARKVYVGEGCWHCHSQFVRPVAREAERWGPVSKSSEYQNELQRPVMFGTRRVGPDLIREGGRRSNDWHAAHFHNPRSLEPQSVMPEYPWFFDSPSAAAGRAEALPPSPRLRDRLALLKEQPPDQPSPLLPNKRGLALILYMQWLGSWQPDYFTMHRNQGLATVESQK